MIWPFLLAGLLAATGTAVHTVLGERTNIRHVWASTLPHSEKLELRGVWHGFSVVLALTALALLAMALTDVVEQPRTLAHVIAVVYTGIGLVWLAVAVQAGVRQAMRVPQWLLLLAIGVLAWWGA